MNKPPVYTVQMSRPLQLVFRGPNDFLIRRKNDRGEMEDFIEFRIIDQTMPAMTTAMEIYHRLNGNIPSAAPVWCDHCGKTVAPVHGCGVGGCPIGEDL